MKAVDRDFIGAALTDRSGTDCYLDLETGHVIADLDSKGTFEAPRYLRIKPLPAWKSYNNLRDFIDDLTDSKIKERLAEAIIGKGAFRRFGHAVRDYPDIEQAWFTARDRWLDEEINEWLADQGLNVALPQLQF